MTTWERTHRQATPITEGDVKVTLREVHGIVGLLEGASRTDRADLYQRLGLELEYEREAATGREIVRARSQLCREAFTFVVDQLEPISMGRPSTPYAPGAHT